MLLDADAILFDNDGVLVDSHADGEAAWTRLAAEFDLDVDVLLGQMAGVRAADTLARHLAGPPLALAISRLEDLEVEFAGNTRPIDGAAELLAALPDGAWTIVTSASERLALARWNAAGIPVPRERVTADDVASGKPDPEPFVTGARRLGVEARRCLVFEDSPSGGAAGHAAGATVIAVGATPWPHEPAARVHDLQAVAVRAPRSAATLTIELSVRG